MDAAKAEAVKLIQENKIVVFSKNTCPFCTFTKDRLKTLFGDPEKTAVYRVAEVQGVKDEDLPDLYPNGEAIAAALKSSDVFNAEELQKEHGITLLSGSTNHRTWPNIWINKKQIGGNSDLSSLTDDQIKALVNA